MELAAHLRTEARATNERRLLVLAGAPDQTRAAAREALCAAEIDTSDTTYVGYHSADDWESIRPVNVSQLLGSTRTAVVFDCHDRCEANSLGQLIGCVDGGGLCLLLTPPFEDWPDRPDEFDETLAVPPSTVGHVGNRFRTRIVEMLLVHPGIGVVDVDSDTVVRSGLTDPAPRLSTTDRPLAIPTETAFPNRAYERCVTQDQIDTLAEFERLLEGEQALVVEANRGRGKSSVAGLAAGSLASAGYDVLVTAPQFGNVRELFGRASELLCDHERPSTARSKSETHDDDSTMPRTIDVDSATIQYARPHDATERVEEETRVIVDEAAAIGVDVLHELLVADSVGFTTTVHGYEGAGRGFSVRFRESLTRSSKTVTDTTMVEPIRYASGDPVEVWSFRTLALDARPPVDPLVEDATPESVEYHQLSPDDLIGNEALLREVFGLLVLAHYRTEPNDLARVLDAPNVSVHALFQNGHPVTVGLVAREGGVSESVGRAMYEGTRVRGNMIPDVLAGQLRDREAPSTAGDRILRIATHSAVRSRGLGSALVDRIRADCAGAWVGAGFGATPPLVRFWRTNGFHTVHVSTSRNQRSGEHSLILLAPLNRTGTELLDRHSDWFLRRFPGTLTDSLASLDADVVREACRGVDATYPLDLSAAEWRILAGIPTGAGIFDTAPRAVRVLFLHYVTESDGDHLSPSMERLLVWKALQCRDWDTVTELGGYPGTSQCRRRFGDAVETLVQHYGTQAAKTELRRLARDDTDQGSS